MPIKFVPPPFDSGVAEARLSVYWLTYGADGELVGKEWERHETAEQAQAALPDGFPFALILRLPLGELPFFRQIRVGEIELVYDRGDWRMPNREAGMMKELFKVVK